MDATRAGDFRALARAITIVENELPGYTDLLYSLPSSKEAKIIGITGPPGAGKSTLVNAIIHHWLTEGKKIAVLAVDPSSPFNYGALLGDRVRMVQLYTNPNVYIRSLASRGALGGLSAKMIEITDVARQGLFDYILVETVGVGQSEVEIAGLADCTVVTLVPEAGDTVQTLKAGIMEIADVFVVNKADRESADTLYRNLRTLTHERSTLDWETQVVKTVATLQTGIQELADAINKFLQQPAASFAKKNHLLTEKAWQLMQTARMAGYDKKNLHEQISTAQQQPDFNLYRFVRNQLEMTQ